MDLTNRQLRTAQILLVGLLLIAFVESTIILRKMRSMESVMEQQHSEIIEFISKERQAKTFHDMELETTKRRLDGIESSLIFTQNEVKKRLGPEVTKQLKVIEAAVSEVHEKIAPNQEGR